jgi:hypothetical protein
MNQDLLNLASQLMWPYIQEKLGLGVQEGGEPGQGSEAAIKDKALLDVKNKLGSVAVLLGTRDTGKTTLAYRYAQFLGRPTFAVSPEQRPPSWITRVELKDIEDRVPVHSTLIVDDLPVVAGNRDYNQALVQKLEKIIPMCRHDRQWHLLFCSQSAAQADKFVLDCDIAFLKPQGILSADVERPFISKLYRDEVNPLFDRRDSFWVKRHAYCITRTWKGIIEISKVD